MFFISVTGVISARSSFTLWNTSNMSDVDSDGDDDSYDNEEEDDNEEDDIYFYSDADDTADDKGNAQDSLFCVSTRARSTVYTCTRQYFVWNLLINIYTNDIKTPH